MPTGIFVFIFLQACQFLQKVIIDVLLLPSTSLWPILSYKKAFPLTVRTYLRILNSFQSAGGRCLRNPSIDR